MSAFGTAAKIPSSYIPLRDADVGLASLSSVERQFIQSCCTSGGRRRNVLRTDGREWNQIRNVQLHFGRSNSFNDAQDTSATVTVTWGAGTRVSCTIAGDIIPPPNDRPNEGVVSLAVDLSPSASTQYRPAAPAQTSHSSNNNLPSLYSGPQKRQAHELLNLLERLVIFQGNAGCLDPQALCIVSGQWVWQLQITVTIVDAASGNLVDAAVLATLAALRHYRAPHVQLSESGGMPRRISPNLKEPVPLPLHHTPLSMSFALVPPLQHPTVSTTTTITPATVALMDPTSREEMVQTGSLRYAMNVHGEVCFMEYDAGGSTDPAFALLRDCHERAETSIRQLCNQLEQALQEADEKALAERLERLQKQQQNQPPPQDMELPPLPNDRDDLAGIPFYQASKDVDMEVDVSISDQHYQEAEVEAEEAYRRQALDYNIGHVPSKLRETDNRESVAPATASSLLQAMLQSVHPNTRSGSEPMTTSIQDTGAMEEQTPPLFADTSSKPPLMDRAASSTVDKQSSVSHNMTLDSDDEEDTTMQLTTEFAAVSKAEPPMAKEDDDDVSDLSAAIVGKKKKKKAKKKK